MRCPRCNCLENRVLDSRQNQKGTSIRRRRECSECSFRFTSHEEIDATTMKVSKRDGTLQDFNWNKVRNGVGRALEKRSFPERELQDFFIDLEADFIEKSYWHKGISSDEIGETVLAHLRRFDIIAYVRFASVYKKFDRIEEFIEMISQLKS